MHVLVSVLFVAFWESHAGGDNSVMRSSNIAEVQLRQQVRFCHESYYDFDGRFARRYWDKLSKLQQSAVVFAKTQWNEVKWRPYLYDEPEVEKTILAEYVDG